MDAKKVKKGQNLTWRGQFLKFLNFDSESQLQMSPGTPVPNFEALGKTQQVWQEATPSNDGRPAGRSAGRTHRDPIMKVSN